MRLLLFSIAVLAGFTAVSAQQRGRGDEHRNEHAEKKPVAVAEPATIALLAASAGTYVAYRLWRKRP